MKAYVTVVRVNGIYYPYVSIGKCPEGITGEAEVVFTIEKEGEDPTVLRQEAILAAQAEAESRGIYVKCL